MVVVTAAAGTGGSHKVLLIPGKPSSASSCSSSFSRPISVVLPSQAAASSDSDSNSSTAGPPVRKRQRLTHLSPEEKALRRKLKNRVAAQTARDRKKAKMGELEQQVLELEQENQKLHIENRLLREKAGSLLAENQELRQRLCLDALDSKEKVQCQLSGGNDAGLGVGSSESAALRLRVSAAGAGPAAPKAEDFSMDTDAADPSHSESDLLLGILDILDPELFLRSCEQELQEQQQQQQEQQPLPVPPTSLAALGAPSVKLEALNELIHFDHIYTKPVEEEEEEEVVSSSSSSSSSSDSESDDKMDEVVVVVEQQQEEVEVETVVCIKDEPEEVEVITGHQADFTSSSSSSPPSSLSGLDQDASLADTYSDSGYERSPSPFSQLPSPLDTETSWDSFASELFPQLITV
ncbi:LOW QUALITY PROTEIN: X-box-binding protein 1 [Nelusetta ayraudi]|uniref:LOW QUALITY PROTEIN: X-box-binding protein 1 n=1 Tax=Nelusetta ayraudi TaxID=303726 RepID=UPI003F71B1C6